jgi:hypothetical protein
MGNMGLTDHLTEEQRRQRIAKILLRGAFLLAKKEGWLKTSADGFGNSREPGASSTRVPFAGAQEQASNAVLLAQPILGRIDL